MGIARVERDWNHIAKENLIVMEISGAVYAFGSELATLRLYRHYKGADNVNQGYSESRKSFYFCLELKYGA